MRNIEYNEEKNDFNNLSYFRINHFKVRIEISECLMGIKAIK